MVQHEPSDCMPSPERAIWTIGHSTRSSEEFLELLRENDIELLADVRRFPGSRLHPHFNKEALSRALGEHGIGYEHFLDLGGRRGKPAENSPNTGWRVESFAAYADYMATDEFAGALARLEHRAATKRTAIMCSEAVPWRCHRRLIADTLIVKGWNVFDIISPGGASPGRLTEFARFEDGTLTYPQSS